MMYEIAMTREKADKLFFKHEEMVLACTYNLLFTNDICCGQVIDAIAMILKSKYYRHKMKVYVNKISDERKRYERMINEIIGDKCDFFADCNDKFLDGLQNDIELLYFSFKKELDKEKIEDSELIARMETARTLVDYSCFQFDMRMSELAKCDTGFRKIPLGYMKLTEMNRLLNLAMREFKPGKKIYLNTENCQMALDNVSKKLTDINGIANAIKTGEGMYD